jgi:hypothetical protein
MITVIHDVKIGYKAFNKDLKGINNFQYIVDKVFETSDPLVLCKNGFHFCLCPSDLDKYYNPNGATEYAIIEILGDVIHDINYTKSATNKIRIIKKVTKKEMISHFIGLNDNLIYSDSLSNNEIDMTDDSYVIKIQYSENKISNFYFQYNMLHRDDDLPAIIRANGDKEWYIEDNRERVDDDLPTVIRANGDKEWYKDNMMCRIIKENGDQIWYVDGKIGRDNIKKRFDSDISQPAIIRANGDREWYNNGELGNYMNSCVLYDEIENYPSIIRANGDKEWYYNGKLENINFGLPAIIRANGDKEWYFNGKPGTNNGLPAIITSKYDIMWYENGQLHRANGLPAIINSSGEMHWYEKGILLKSIIPSV